MEPPARLRHDGRDFQSADALKQSHPVLFYGTASVESLREFVRVKKVPDADNILVFFKPDGTFKVYSCTEKPSPKAKVYLSCAWVDAALARQDETPQVAPPVLQLTDDEKFKAADGSPLSIEVRGERHHERIFFLAKDVAAAFNTPHLTDIVTDPEAILYNEGISHSPEHRKRSP